GRGSHRRRAADRFARVGSWASGVSGVARGAGTTSTLAKPAGHAPRRRSSPSADISPPPRRASGQMGDEDGRARDVAAAVRSPAAPDLAVVLLPLRLDDVVDDEACGGHLPDV